MTGESPGWVTGHIRPGVGSFTAVYPQAISSNGQIIMCAWYSPDNCLPVNSAVRHNPLLFPDEQDMWFKNLRIYRFTKDIDLSSARLESALAGQAFKPCNNMDFSRYGWVPPLGGDSELYTHQWGNFIMLCSRKQEKILPPAAINELVEEKVSDFESARSRDIYRREKLAIRDDVIHSLLPRALVRSFVTYACIDIKGGLLIIDTAATNKAEEFLDHLRASLGGLPVVPLSCHGDAANIMTHWLKERMPEGLKLDNECELQNPRESRNIVRCKNQELESAEINAHLKAGKRVVRLALLWRDSIRFVLAGDMSIRRLRFEKVVQDQARGEAADRATQFDQDFAVMALQLHQFIPELLEQFGGPARGE